MELEHEDRAASHAVEGLTDDLAVLAQEGLHVCHAPGNQRWCTTLREPGRVDLFVHVPQALRAVDDQSPLLFGPLQDVSRIDVLGVERRVFAHQQAVKLRQWHDSRLPKREPVLRIGTYRERARVPQGDAVAKRQVALLEIRQLEATRLSGEEHRERRVFCEFDVVDGVHHDTEPSAFSHLSIPVVRGRRRQALRRAPSKPRIMLGTARICCSHAHLGPKQRATF